MSKLGMQRFPRTVAIQVAPLRPGDSNTAYIAAIHELALGHGGIPHWGEEHALDEPQVEALYGEEPEPWRWALAETEAEVEPEAEVGGAFSSAFTRTRGLETR